MKKFEIVVNGKSQIVEAEDAQSAASMASNAPNKNVVADKIATRDPFINPVLNPAQAFESMRGKMSTGGAVSRGMAGLEAMGAVPTALESTISAPIVEGTRQVQSGRIEPQKLFQEFLSGLSGKKKYEFGDIARQVGVPEGVSATLGLGASVVAGGAGLRKILSAIPQKISKSSDKGIKVAGEALIKGSDEALNAMKLNLDNAYAPVANARINPANIISIADDLPPALIAEAEKMMGKQIQNFNTISDLRELKSIVGKYRPSAFGKASTGVAETLEGEKINRAYKTIKSAMHDELIAAGLGRQSKAILDADTAFVNIKKASDYIRKSVVVK